MQCIRLQLLLLDYLPPVSARLYLYEVIDVFSVLENVDLNITVNLTTFHFIVTVYASASTADRMCIAVIYIRGS